jgi:hypothetical protein
MPRRTTLTLDDDVARRLDEETRERHRPLRAVVNDALRRGLEGPKPAEARPFKVKPRRMGTRPDLNLDSIAQLLDQVERSPRR